MCFTGHLTGAGGGYAEKTFTTGESVPGKTLTINVGSIGGLSASSVSGEGFTTVSASNATESSYSWSCTNNSTARDASNDNPISVGFSIPVCGYQNSISGYYNKGGTASGGDINRTGGDGVIIPEFLYDSYLDGITGSGAGGGASGNTSSCWINPTVTCACMPCGNYHTTFGNSSYGGKDLVSCLCQALCTCVVDLCACTTAGTISSRYTFVGKNTKDASAGFVGAAATMSGVADASSNDFIKDVPAGVGGQSGTSSDNGRDGYSEMVVTNATLSKSQTGGNPYNICYFHTNWGYDYSFGGTGCTRMCIDYDPGCYSACTSFTGACGAHGWCYKCVGFAFTYYFGSTQSGNPGCLCMPCGLAHCANPVICFDRSHNLGFMQDKALGKSDEYVIPTSTLLDENGTNISDIKYGNGAGISTSAGYGGGGNRLYPAGGSGLVVVLY